jgi:23S rRNA pseudouridine2604 synthase
VGPDGKQRVAKLLAWRGLCSRREAEKLIEHGNVLVNGVVIREPGARCAPEDDLQLTAYGDRWLAGQLTVLLHKPVGIVSTQAEENQQPAWQLLTADRAVPGCDPEIVQAVSDKPWQLHVAGRLDRASRGLLLLTQDGVLARTVTGTRTLTKHYQVKTDSPANPAQITELNRMRRLEGEPILSMHVTHGQRGVLRFELQEGKKHHIRRACEAVQLKVTDLFRDRIGSLSAGGLPEGCWRPVTAEELEQLGRKRPS